MAGEDPIGHQILAVGRGREQPWMTIVGIVRGARHVGPLRDSMLEIYFPFAQYGSTDLQPRALVVRTAGNLAAFVAPQRFDAFVLAISGRSGLFWRPWESSA